MEDRATRRAITRKLKTEEEEEEEEDMKEKQCCY